MTKQEILLMLDDVDSIVANAPEDSIFDIVETYHNVTVEILKNSKTGEVSIGWCRSNPMNISYGENYDDKRRIC